jgi:hypothetical protein
MSCQVPGYEQSYEHPCEASQGTVVGVMDNVMDSRGHDPRRHMSGTTMQFRFDPSQDFGGKSEVRIMN